MGRWVALLVLLLIVCGCDSGREGKAVRLERPVVSGVAVSEIRLAERDDFYQTSGTLAARTTSRVAARMMGAVTSVLVREGQQVTAGQLLATLDDRDAAQKVAAAAAALAEAEKGMAAAGRQRELAAITHQRYERLFAGKALTRQELDQARTASEIAALEYGRMEQMVERARAGAGEAAVYREYARITAPVSGVVIAKGAEVGSMAMPGAPLFTIEDNSAFTLDLWVSETLVDRLTPRNPVFVDIAGATSTPGAAILDIVPTIDPATRTFLVKVAVTGNGLRAGQHAAARIAVGRGSALYLPAAAIVRKGQLTGVYAVNRDNVLSYRLVRLGREVEGMTEILTGLAPGEKVVVAGVERAVDGGVLVEEKRQ